MHAYDRVSSTQPAYETKFQDAIQAGTPAPEDLNGWAFPMLFEKDGNWMLISESDVDENYCGMHLEANCEGGLYKMRLPEDDEALDLCQMEPVVELPAVLPWRFILVSDQLSSIVESNMVTHLAKENQLDDVSWIRPGRASWSWWSMQPAGPRNFDNLKKYVDLSATMGWEYSLLDFGWPDMEGGSIEELVAYADEKGVGLLVWYNSGGRWNTTEGARQSILYDPEKRKKEFRRIHEIGIKGIKADFFNSDKQGIIDQYMGILKDAADNQLVANFHGCTLPRGWRRTYPHLLSMEAICGQEAYRYDETYPEKAPKHQVIAAFTRNVIGPMDFTPVGLSDRTYPHLTSYAFEMAQTVVFESGVVHICDSPEAYGLLPGFAVDFLKKVPVAWDETRLVGGYPGQYVIMARRKGDTWYIGCLNGEKETKEITFSLPFLDTPGTLKLMVDGPDNKALEENEYTVSSDTELTIKVLPFGGFSGLIELISKE